MKSTSKLFFLIIILSLPLTSCYQEDPGPKLHDERSYSVVDFDRIEASDALTITVQQGNSFSISANGDSRNLNDLDIRTNGTTLLMDFRKQQKRQYTTYITIIMPSLNGINFSGAVNSKISGFNEIDRMDISLSGASLTQIEGIADAIYLQLSGASQLRLFGTGNKVDANVSGASLFSAFDFPVDEAHLVVSGASHAKVNASQKLSVNASGASGVIYRGSPQTNFNVTGASSVNRD